jgi:hypothetical protein
MIKIGGAAMLRDRSSLLLRKMDMNDGDAAVARLSSATFFGSEVSM